MFRSQRVALVLLLACGSVRASVTTTAEPFVGVVHHRVVQSAKDDKAEPVLPRPVVVDILEIDTKAPGIRFEMSPGNGDKPGEITRALTRVFVDKVQAQIGINVGFYDTKANYGGLDTDLVHLASANGEVFSNAHGDEWVFDISKDNRPRIAQADGADKPTIAGGSAVYNAAGGNQPMLHDGKVVTPDSNYTKALNPHTAVGISRDKRKVFLVTVDGRQKGYSEGLRTDEMAELMKRFGAWDAINFDGGGSTTMVIDDTDDGKANSRVLNSPSDFSSPAHAGKDRVVANSLAVFATPKPGYVALADVPRPTMADALPILTARTVLDDFENGAGHFGANALTSGSNKGVDAKSSATLDKSGAHGGSGALKLSCVGTGGAEDFQLRVLSGDASPTTNTIDGKAMGNEGFVGVWLKRDASEKGPLFVSIVVDDGSPDSFGTERGRSFRVEPDGQWHLYQWGLNEDAKWLNYNGGNAKIDGPNVFVDSLVFRTAKDNEPSAGAYTGTIWIDDLTYEPSGEIK